MCDVPRGLAVALRLSDGQGAEMELSFPISHLLTSGWVLSQFKQTYHSCPLFAQLLQADKSGGLIGDRYSVVVKKMFRPLPNHSLCCVCCFQLLTKSGLKVGVVLPALNRGTLETSGSSKVFMITMSFVATHACFHLELQPNPIFCHGKYKAFG